MPIMTADMVADILDEKDSYTQFRLLNPEVLFLLGEDSSPL